MTAFVDVVLCVLIFAAYFAPTIIAGYRDMETAKVAVINVFLGWTFVGWVIALALALTSQKKYYIVDSRNDGVKRD